MLAPLFSREVGVLTLSATLLASSPAIRHDTSGVLIVLRSTVDESLAAFHDPLATACSNVEEESEELGALAIASPRAYAAASVRATGRMRL